MKLCRYNDNRLGLVKDGRVTDVTAALDVVPQQSYPLAWADPMIAALPEIMVAAEALFPDGAASALPLEEIKLLSPVANPPRIIGAPVNYRRHIKESRADAAIHHDFHKLEGDEPIRAIGMFLKSPTSLVGPSEGVALKLLDRRNDHEVELALIIGRRGRDIPYAEAMDYIAAYTIGLDMVVRGREGRSLRKSIDSYSVLGPWLVTADEIPDPGNLALSISVNGEIRQQSNTRYLLYDVSRLIEFTSSYYELHPGDVIMTGTPDGVGPVQPGDLMHAEIESIGAMDVSVRAYEA